MAQRHENRQEESGDADRLAEEQAAAAAAEAAEIGGPAPNQGQDPAQRPVTEAGGGVAEGFEETEAELIRAASYQGDGVPPEEDAFSPERESDRSSAAYGEPDEID